jgi:nucleotide-binding universal stress UspA family protein
VSGAVVVGVSPTTGSPAALRWGAEEAKLRGATLRAVMAWRAPRPPAAPGGRPPTSAPATTDEAAADAERILRAYVDEALDFPADVQCEVVKGSAVTALLATARDAQLLVVGEPRPGRLANVRSSLVAPQVVVKSPCPVVVMPSGAA